MDTKTDESKVGTTLGEVKLVLNGGKSVMEHATIPLQWFFSPALIEKRPTEVLIIEQDESEYESGFSEREGARYTRKITDRVAFIQMFKPGKHRIAVIALSDVPSEFGYLENRSDRFYHHNIYFSKIARAIETGDFSEVGGKDVIGATIQEIEVPAELFAAKSESRFGKTVWNWTNRWWKHGPRDQCDFRRRLILAFTIQPPLFAIGMLLRFIAQIFLSLVLPLVQILTLFVGYRPFPIFEQFGDIWKWNWESLMRTNKIFSPYSIKSYRVWEEDADGRVLKRMPVTGLEVLCIITAYILFREYAATIIFGFLSSAVVLVGLIGFAWVSRLLSPRMSDEELAKLREKEFQDRYSRWLVNLSSNRAPDKFSLKQLPVAYQNGLVQRFWVGFWNTKIKVCRPYPK